MPNERIRMGIEWFDDRFQEIKTQGYDFKEKIELILRELIWRIQELEKEVAQPKG